MKMINEPKWIPFWAGLALLNTAILVSLQPSEGDSVAEIMEVRKFMYFLAPVSVGVAVISFATVWYMNFDRGEAVPAEWLRHDHLYQVLGRVDGNECTTLVLKSVDYPKLSAKMVLFNTELPATLQEGMSLLISDNKALPCNNWHKLERADVKETFVIRSADLASGVLRRHPELLRSSPQSA